jgi:hypothetical protein
MVQVHDGDDSNDLVTEFRDLNTSIAHLCDNITDYVLGDSMEASTLDILKAQLPADFAPDSLITSAAKTDIIVLTLFKYHMSKTLHLALARFHPQETNGEIDECYRSIRRAGQPMFSSLYRGADVFVSEPQGNAARWRAWTYKVLESKVSSQGREQRTLKLQEAAAIWARKTAKFIVQDSIKPVSEIFRSKSDFALNSRDQAQLERLLVRAYLWKHKVNTSFFHHDFHPQFLGFDDVFDAQQMEREGANKAATPTRERMIACVGMGLKSSIARGPNDQPKEVWQLKVPVVTADEV